MAHHPSLPRPKTKRTLPDEASGSSRPTKARSPHRDPAFALRRPARVNAAALPILDPDTAGIDVGATELHVAVPPDRCPQPVQVFSAFTPGLHALRDWLHACGVRSVALESTGVYWIPIYQILAAAGLQMCLVNARHLKHVRGRKTDVSDCQWLQHLHAVGLLQGSFRPAEAICALRSILRHRDHLVGQAAQQVQHVQKALDQMNLHLHHVLTDITGVSGRRIVEAILAGEQDPEKLADLREESVKASRDKIIAALTGDFRREHLFVLRQAWDLYGYYHAKLAECDREAEALLQDCESQAAAEDAPPPPPNAPRNKKRKNQIHFEQHDLRCELFRLYGTDITQVPGLGVSTVLQLYGELGADLSAFGGKASRFKSWLAVCPDPRKSGGKILRHQTRAVKHRVATLFRLAAQSLWQSRSPLGDYFRRMKARLGGPQAITATAHKLARIFFHLVTTKEAYDESLLLRAEEHHQTRKLERLKRQVEQLGYELVPRPEPCVS